MSDSDKHKNNIGLALRIYRQLTVDTTSALFSSILCSALFNPWDRALYLSVKYQGSFLSMANFVSPYQGILQSMVQRAFSGSIYYIMQGQMKSFLYPYLRNSLGVSELPSQFFVGMFAGSTSGILTNGISAVKYHTWGQDNRTFISSVREMWSLGGYRTFVKGTGATMGRDMMFGSTYEVLRNLLRSNHLVTGSNDSFKNESLNFLYNSISAGVATIVSGPLNYVRNIQYATPSHIKSPSIVEVLRNVCHESNKYANQPFGRFLFFQNQFRIGWGTGRVAVGMAVGQKLFDSVRSELSELLPEHSKPNV